MSGTAKWSGYDFTLYGPSTTWNAVGGVYIFAGLKDGDWQAFYIGQAINLRECLLSHERWEPARKLGATHIHAMVVPLAGNRDTIEKGLIGTFQPPLNTKLK